MQYASNHKYISLDQVAEQYLSPGQRSVLFLADTAHQAFVIQDHLLSIKEHSRHFVTTVNPIEGRSNADDYVEVIKHTEVILIHYSIYILGNYFLNDRWVELISNSKALKVQIIQDEYRTIFAMTSMMRRLGVSGVFSSLNIWNLRRVYGHINGPPMTFVSCLPGYITHRLADVEVKPLSCRPVDVVYRGRPLPFHLGRDAQMKSELGRAAQLAARRLGLTTDLAYAEEDRVYGTSWEELLRSGKLTLGCEGGSQIFDFDGSIERVANSFLESNPDATYADVKGRILKFYEYNVIHKTITPRIIEAGLLGTPMALVRGQYRGVLQPDEHYVPIEPCMNNLLKALSLVKTDPDRLQEMAIEVREHLLAQSNLFFEHYVAMLDLVLGNVERSVG